MAMATSPSRLDLPSAAILPTRALGNNNSAQISIHSRIAYTSVGRSQKLRGLCRVFEEFSCLPLKKSMSKEKVVLRPI